MVSIFLIIWITLFCVLYDSPQKKFDPHIPYGSEEQYEATKDENNEAENSATGSRTPAT